VGLLEQPRVLHVRRDFPWLFSSWIFSSIARRHEFESLVHHAVELRRAHVSEHPSHH